MDPQTDLAAKHPAWEPGKTRSLPEVHGTVPIPLTGGFWKKMLAFAGPPVVIWTGDTICVLSSQQPNHCLFQLLQHRFSERLSLAVGRGRGRLPQITARFIGVEAQLLEPAPEALEIHLR